MCALPVRRLLPLITSLLLATPAARAQDAPVSEEHAPAPSAAPQPAPGARDSEVTGTSSGNEADQADRAAPADTPEPPADKRTDAAADIPDEANPHAAAKGSTNTTPPVTPDSGPPADSNAPGPAGGQPEPAAPEEPAEPAAEPLIVEEPIGDLYDLGAQLFEAFAPEEIKERYRFPTREEWDSFAVRLVDALESSSLKKLAEMEPDARAALDALRALPDYEQYADWLEDRLDDISVAQQATDPATKSVSPSEPAAPSETQPDPIPTITEAVPLYDVWLERMRRRPPPVRAAHLVPRLKPVFVQAELPPELVWIAETESSFNPAARSPVGARGLFQLMPGTAKDLGLRLFPFDERLDPLKNATSAARYLSKLYARFDDWPLALAAYNAGPARVSRILKKHDARTFAEIAEHLPSETRLYVPKVLATIAVREGITPITLSRPVAGDDVRADHAVPTPSGERLAAAKTGF